MIKTVLAKILLFVVILLAGLRPVLGQQEANLTLYRYHMNVLNPAIVGVEGETWINASLRRQWSNIEFAPETQAVSLGVPVGGNLGVGVSVIQDRTFIESQTGVYADFSYRVRLGLETDLYLGLKAGGTNYAVNVSGLETYNYIMDLSLQDIRQFNPNIGAGVYLNGERFFLSLSVPRLLTTDRTDDGGGVATVAQNRPHIYLSSGYDFWFSDTVEFSPSFLLRYVEGAPVSVDLLTLVTFSERFSIGAAYRTDRAISGIVSLELSKRITLGYAYESSLRTELQASAGNTHELVFRFLLARRP